MVASIVDMALIWEWWGVARMHLEGELRKLEEPNGRDAELKGPKNEQAVAFLVGKAKAGTGER